MAIRADIIEYPQRVSEAEIEAELRNELIKRGLDARLQVRGRLGSRLHKLDIVVFKNTIPQVIIECKSWSRRYYKERKYQGQYSTRQVRKYQRWGLPVFICGRAEDIQSVAEEVTDIYNESNYEPIHQPTQLTL